MIRITHDGDDAPRSVSLLDCAAGAVLAGPLPLEVLRVAGGTAQHLVLDLPAPARPGLLRAVIHSGRDGGQVVGTYWIEPAVPITYAVAGADPAPAPQP